MAFKSSLHIQHQNLALTSITKLRHLQQSKLQASATTIENYEIKICTNKTCKSQGSQQVHDYN